MLVLQRPGSTVDAGTPLSLAEYLALPEDTSAEIVDGVLRPMTRSTQQSRNVQRRIANALEATAPVGLRVLEEEIVVLSADPVAARIPDVAVVRASPGQTWDVNHTPASDVVLAVEVLSPRTRTVDTREKPVEYALAGIGSYWLVELEVGVTVTVHRLATSASYEVCGRYGAGDKVMDPTLPWVDLDVDSLGVYH